MPNTPLIAGLFLLIVAATAALAWAIWRAERPNDSRRPAPPPEKP